MGHRKLLLFFIGLLTAHLLMGPYIPFNGPCWTPEWDFWFDMILCSRAIFAVNVLITSCAGYFVIFKSTGSIFTFGSFLHYSTLIVYQYGTIHNCTEQYTENSVAAREKKNVFLSFINMTYRVISNITVSMPQFAKRSRFHKPRGRLA